MRIAVLTHMYPAWCETFQRREVEALASLGHEVMVFTKTAPIGPPVESTVSTRSVDKVESFRPDVIYGGLSQSAHVRACSFSQSLKVPFVLRIWSGLDTFRHPSPELYRRLTGDPGCLGVIVEDAFMKTWAELQMGCRSPVYRVPNSMDVSQFNPEPVAADLPIVLAVGRLIPKKGFIYLVRAMWQVKSECRLVIVGDGEERANLEREAGPNVVFAGNIPEELLRIQYRQCSMLVAPCIRTPEGDGDGIPTVVLEAMATGRPVIASDVLSASRYVDHGRTGYLVPSADAAELAARIDQLLSDPAKAQEMGCNARSWAGKYLDIQSNILTIESILAGKCGEIAA